MKRRRPDSSVRQRLRTWLVELDDLYGDPARYGDLATRHYAEQIARLDSGAPMRAHAWEVDLTPASAYLEIDADGTVTVLEPG